MQYAGTFHSLVCSGLRWDLWLFNHSERLSFSFIRFDLRVNAGDNVLLLLATTAKEAEVN